MKQTKLLIGILLTCMILFTTACSSQDLSPSSQGASSEESGEISQVVSMSEEIPDISIMTQDGKTIPYEEAYTIWNGKMFKRAELLPSGNTLPTEGTPVQQGETITLHFSEPYPDEVIISSQIFLYDETSGYFQKSPSLEERFITSENGVYTFELTHEGNVAYFLSCQWENNVCEYAFLLLTSPTEEETLVSTVEGANQEVVSSAVPTNASSIIQNSTGTSEDANALIRARFRALGLTFYQDGAEVEQQWIDHAKLDFQKNNVMVNAQTVIYIEKVNERSFTINYPNQTGGTPTPAATTSSVNTSPSATGIYAKPYDTQAIIDDVWIYAQSKGFWLDTSRQKGNSSWAFPIDTRYTSNLQEDLKYRIDTEASQRFIGEMNIVAVSLGNGEYEFYFFR